MPEHTRATLKTGLLLVLLACLGACARAPDEQALRDSIAAIEQAVEAGDAGAVAEHMADDFIGPQGADADATRRMAQLMMLRHRDVEARLGPLDIALQEGHATVRFTAAVTSGRGLPDSAQVYDVETGWRVEQGGWRLVSADWKPKL